MARYIDANALIAKLNVLKEEWGFTFTADGVEEAIFKVEEEPTADVVPKSEVETLAKEVDRLSQCVLYNDGVTEMLVEEAKQEVTREIFAEIEKNECHDISGKMTMYMLFAEEFAELKRKYDVTDTNVSHKQTEGKT